jgi:hypothetical protein
MAILIKPNGSELEVHPKIPPKGFQLAELYALLECTCVQGISLRDGRIMWMDEESKLKDAPPDLNARATQLLYDAGGMPDDFILGNVLICDRKEVR